MTGSKRYFLPNVGGSNETKRILRLHEKMWFAFQTRSKQLWSERRLPALPYKPQRMQISAYLYINFIYKFSIVNQYVLNAKKGEEGKALLQKKKKTTEV